MRPRLRRGRRGRNRAMQPRGLSVKHWNKPRASTARRAVGRTPRRKPNAFRWGIRRRVWNGSAGTWWRSRPSVPAGTGHVDVEARARRRLPARPCSHGPDAARGVDCLSLRARDRNGDPPSRPRWDRCRAETKILLAPQSGARPCSSPEARPAHLSGQGPARSSWELARVGDKKGGVSLGYTLLRAPRLSNITHMV